MLSFLCVKLTIKAKVGIPESFKVGWYRPNKTGSSHLKELRIRLQNGQVMKLLNDLDDNNLLIVHNE